MLNYIESEVIQRLRDGDEGAFNEVYAQFSSKIYKVAYRILQDSTQSEEILQETFISLWVNKEKLDISGDLWVYLFVIAKRKSFDILRDVKKSQVLQDWLVNTFDELKNSTEEKIIVDELQRITDSILDSLPGQQQKIYRLCRLENLSHSEIASKLNISTNTVKNHMVQANRTLKLKLQYYLLISLICMLAFSF